MEEFFIWDWMQSNIVPPLLIASLICFMAGLYWRPLRPRFWAFIMAAICAFAVVTIDVCRAFDAHWFHVLVWDCLYFLGGVFAVWLAVISGKLIREKRRQDEKDESCRPG
ncbi:MAG: hypothetical protein U9Q03_03945 [Patescibacteria group bacterium]|nr:hypothetical protein [Patescibacteria group bacterium]